MGGGGCAQQPTWKYINFGMVPRLRHSQALDTNTSRSSHRPGKYTPFSVIVRGEGSDAAAMKATVNIVMHEVRLMKAGKWLSN
eukprot:3411027-Alexandrium_andersonii.AAC.1